MKLETPTTSVEGQMRCCQCLAIFTCVAFILFFLVKVAQKI
jgi:hypothetical protein